MLVLTLMVGCSLFATDDSSESDASLRPLEGRWKWDTGDTAVALRLHQREPGDSAFFLGNGEVVREEDNWDVNVSGTLDAPTVRMGLYDDQAGEDYRTVRIEGSLDVRSDPDRAPALSVTVSALTPEPFEVQIPKTGPE